MNTIIRISFLLAAAGAITLSTYGDLTIRGTEDCAPAEFAADDIQRAFQTRRAKGDWVVSFRLLAPGDAPAIRPEGFRLTTNNQTIEVAAIDPPGLLYGGLDVAERIRTAGIEAVSNAAQNAYLQMRGTKFNIPLDARTPSYTDVCDAAQNNIPEMWSFDFWREYIDTLARYRYNYVSLWSLHPFPSLVKVPDYPDVALDDVWRSKVKWKEHYPLSGKEFVTEEILREVEIVNTLTIDQKINFWRKVMAYGKSRNVDFYVVTWNIFTYGTGGQYGITDDVRNPTTIDYFRQSVKQMFLTYPDLAGIGLTTGENMHGVDFQTKEDWAMATYGQGVLDAAKEQPDRKIRFIHRQHMANATDIARTFQPLVDHPNIDFIFSFKYAKAHVYSATTQPYHPAFVDDLGDLKTIWTLRNDDVYYFRWGAPDFVREFVQNIPREVSQGYYYGSDQYTWGREFLQRGTTGRRPLEIDKHWYQWLLWGRFAYDPTLDNTRLQGILAARFGLTSDAGEALFDAWQNASMIYPLTTGFHWGQLDFQWYIEGCQSLPRSAENETGFHDVNRFITLKPHAHAHCLSIPEYVNLHGQANESGKRTPLEVADRIDQRVEQSQASRQRIPSSDHAELQQTLADIRIVQQLGAYYADKIRGATQLALFRESGDPEMQTQAIQSLVAAARHWHAFATQALQHHRNPLWTNRVGHVDWRANYLLAREDIRIAGGDPTQHDLPASVESDAEPVAWNPIP